MSKLESEAPFHMADPVMHIDERGWLAELIRLDGSMPVRPGGQFFITTANPGRVKGNHYHLRKREVFCVIQGQGEMVMRPAAGSKSIRIPMTVESLTRVVTMPGYSHAVVNRGTEEMVMLVYVDECFDPNDPDTIPDVVVDPTTLEIR